jgi:hypothetical protein
MFASWSPIQGILAQSFNVFGPVKGGDRKLVVDYGGGMFTGRPRQSEEAAYCIKQSSCLRSV